MSFIVTFLILFIGGPLIFRQLMRMDIGHRGLTIGVAFFMIMAVVMRYGFGDLWSDDARMTVMMLFFIWMAWIFVLALGALALRSKMPGMRVVRWTSIIGMAGTTVPWFGLASASLIEG